MIVPWWDAAWAEGPEASTPATEDPPPVTEVVVWGRSEEPGPEVLAVDDTDVDRTGARTLAEVLEQSVAFNARAGGRGERIFTLRGFDQRQVAVFVDGVPSTVPYDGQIDLGKFPATMVGRIDVAGGASAGLFGPGGLGGAVLIRTRPAPDVPGARANIRASSFGGVDASAWGGGPLGPARLALSVGARGQPGWPLPGSFAPTSREDGGLRDASDLSSLDLHARADLPIPRAGTWSATFNGMSGAWNVPTSLTDDAPRFWTFSQYDDLSASAGHASAPGARVRSEERLFVAANTNVLDAFDDASRTSQERYGFHSTYRDHRVGGRASIAHAPADGPVELRGWVFVDHQRHVGVDDIGEPEDRAATTLGSTALAAAVAEGNARAFLGVEADGEVPAEGDFAPAPFALGPSFGAGWHTRIADLDVGVARRTRAPTLKERFSTAFGLRVPNLDLGPESAWHFGVDAELRPAEALRVQLSAWDAEVRGLIDSEPVGGGLSQYVNVNAARLAGGEGAVVATWPAALASRLSAGLLSARRTDTPPPDDRLEYRPAFQVAVDETLRLPEDLSLWSGLQVVGPQYFQDSDTLDWGQLGTWARWDASVTWAPSPSTSVRLRGTNLLDASYQTARGFPEPGRAVWVEVGVGDG